jgi:hypothetical protein
MIQHVIAVTPIPGGYVLELDDASTFRWPGDTEAVPTVGDAVTVEVRDTPGCGLLRYVGLAGYPAVPEMRTGTAYAPLAAPPPVERVRPEPTVTVNAVTCPTDSTWIAYLSDGRAFASTTSAPKPGTPVWFGEGGAMHWPAGTAEHCPAILEDFERTRRAAHPLDPDRDWSPTPFVAGVGPDAPTVTHPNGAKESACLYALDAIPNVQAAVNLAATGPLEAARQSIGNALQSDTLHGFLALDPILDAIADRLGRPGNRALALLEVGRVLADGERKYGERNWHGIPERQHFRHALTHLVADAAGDRSEGEIGHLTRAFCRIAFAIEVRQLGSFSVAT